ncbi:MAG: DUF3105 domain-containing protein [Acidimicrobiia bacterium]
MAGGQGGRRKPPVSKPKAKEAMRRNLAIAVVAVLFVALLGVCLSQRSGDKKAQDALVAEMTAGDCRYDTRTDSGSEHVENPGPYSVDPPSGGDHTPQAAANGIYGEQQVPPDGPLVHAMEHGFIVVWYKAGDADAQVDAETLGDDYPGETLVVPRASLDVPIAATAWHRRLLCPSFEADALRAFIEGYRDKGPEKGFVQIT